MNRKSTVATYARPRQVERVEDCDFYHSIELPGVGLQKGVWDLRNDVDAYIGHQQLAGKTVLDVGTGSGFLCFEMEKRGANLIAFDFDAALGTRQHDIVPFHDFESHFGSSHDAFLATLAQGLDRMKNSFWLSHRLLGSKARVFYGDVYGCDADFGPVDAVFMGNILLHLVNPIQALNTFAPYARERLIITEACSLDLDYDSDDPVCYLWPKIHQLAPGFLKQCLGTLGLWRPDPERRDFATWWQLTPGFLKQYLGVLGFRTFRLGFHKQRWAKPPTDVRHFTLVASR